MKNICVYCGSSPGNLPAYAQAAEVLGKLLAERSIGLVYGGGSVGIMGVLADSVLSNGGSATGVIPRGMLSLIGGKQGLGKSFLVCDIAARISTGRPMPTGVASVPGNVLLLAREDDASSD